MQASKLVSHPGRQGRSKDLLRNRTSAIFALGNLTKASTVHQWHRALVKFPNSKITNVVCMLSSSMMPVSSHNASLVESIVGQQEDGFVF
jgi:hypothetical protein